MISVSSTRSVWLLAMVLGVTGGLRAQSSPAGEGASEMPLVTRTLPNGLEVVVFPDHSVPLITVEMAIKMGSVYETAKDSGLAHLFEHMFFRSNRAVVNNEEYVRDIGGKGIAYNGSTHEEFSNYYLTGLKEDLPVIMHYLRDAALYPTFDPDEVANEIEVVLDENDRNKSNLYSQASTRCLALLFPGNPTFKNPAGLASVLRAATPDRMRAMHERFVVPTNAVLVVTGDCVPAEVFRLATEYFGAWPRGAGNPAVPDPGPPPAQSVAEIIESPGVETAIITFAWRGPSVATDTGATYAADVLTHVISQPDSRFQKALVDSGLTTSVGGNYYTQRHIGPITFILQTTAEKARDAVRVFKEELKKFTAPGYFTDQELENAKASLAASELFNREKPTEYAHSLGFWAAAAGISYQLGQQQAYRGTNREDIVRYVRRYLQGQPFAAVAVVAPGTQQGKLLAPEDLKQP